MNGFRAMIKSLLDGDDLISAHTVVIRSKQKSVEVNWRWCSLQNRDSHVGSQHVMKIVEKKMRTSDQDSLNLQPLVKISRTKCISVTCSTSSVRSFFVLQKTWSIDLKNRMRFRIFGKIRTPVTHSQETMWSFFRLNLGTCGKSDYFSSSWKFWWSPIF